MKDVDARQSDPAGSELSALLDEAENKLASSELGTQAGFNALPVIFVIGPEGSGKTTAMMQSGLDPELLAGQASHDDVIVPTALLNIWYAGQTIFVEPGHRVREDRDLWMRLLQRMRTNSEVSRAAIVCFGCENFATAKAASASTEVARFLRTTLADLSKTLAVQLPIYVLFSRLDRIPFFHEYVRHLDDRESEQVLGATLTRPERRPAVFAERESARLSQVFQDLIYALCGKRPDLLARETDGATLGPIYEFPREFYKLRADLVHFLVELCRPGQLQPNPFLRGFYFFGMRPVVIQEQVSDQAPTVPARPGDTQAFDPSKTATVGLNALDAQTTPAFRFDLQMTQVYAMPVPPRPVRFSLRTIEQWILLKDLFSTVLLHDRASTRVTELHSKPKKPERAVLAAGVALFILLAAALTGSFLRNRAVVNDVRDAARGMVPMGSVTNQAPLAALERLESLRLTLVRLRDYERHGPPWTMRWGLYSGSSVYPTARRIYFDGFKSLLFKETQSSLATELKALPQAPGAGDGYGRAYDTLKAWLETTSHHDAAVTSFLPPVLEEHWIGHRDVDPQTRKLARAQFDFYASELMVANPYSTDETPGIVENARRYLAQFGDSMRIYKAILADVNRANPPLIFNQRFPESANVVSNNCEMPSAFTNAGFELMQAEMKNAARYNRGEDWVLGKNIAAAADNSLESKIRATYYSEYIDQWRDYLRKSAVVKFANLEDAAKKLGVMSGPRSPLFELLGLASQNTSVAASEINNAFGPLHRLAPPAIETYKASLANLRSAVEESSRRPTDQNEAQIAKTRDAERAVGALARRIAEGLGRDRDAHIETIITRLLESPATYVEAINPLGFGVESLNAAGALLCRQFRGLFSKYPFQPNARTAATLDEVSAIFRPREGALSKFYETNLKKLVVKQGNQYASAPNAKTALRARFLRFFSQSMQFSEALYRGGGPDPGLSFALSPAFPSDIQTVTLTIDGQTATLTPGAPAKQFSWPGTGARMTAKGATDYIFPTYDGLWGVFDFFYDADKPPPRPEWMLRGGRRGTPVLSPTTNQPVVVRFELDMLGNPPVFQKGYFQDLACVAEVAAPLE